jgi:hypothetical protein
MSDLCRFVVISTMMLAVLASGVLLQPQEPGVDRNNLLNTVRMYCGREPYATPDARDRALLARIRERSRIINELLAGRLTFFDAASLFLHINREQAADHLPSNIPGRTEEERACRHVILWVRATLQNDSPKRAQWEVAQMEAELDWHLEYYGTVILAEAEVQ